MPTSLESASAVASPSRFSRTNMILRLSGSPARPGIDATDTIGGHQVSCPSISRNRVNLLIMQSKYLLYYQFKSMVELKASLEVRHERGS